MIRTLDDYEADWLAGLVEQIILTPKSVFVSVGVPSSPVASGYIVFEDFAACIGWFWRDVAESLNYAPPIAGITSLPEWEQAFRSLLDRYLQEGYQSEMEGELRSLVDAYCSGYELGSFHILPNDLEYILDWVGNPLVDEEEESEQVPPPFDFTNPDHMAALEQKLQWLTEI